MQDMALLRAYAQDESEAAFAALVNRHLGLVYSAALRQLKDSQLAEDVSQAVFILLAKKANRLSSATVLSGWLLKTTRYAANAQIRTAIRRSKREEEASVQSILNESTTIPWERLAPLLDEAMSSLGDADRNAIALRFFENKKAGEIAEAMKLNEEAAKKRIGRALEKLRKFFLKRGVDSTAAPIGETISANSVQVAPLALAKIVTGVAVSKGAAASASTLALIKGTSNALTWATAKTAIVVGTAAIVLAVGVGSLSASHRKLPVGKVAPMIAFGYSRDFIILASDGSLWSFGEERLGWPVLGLGNIHNSTSLRRIGKESDWVSIAVGDAQNLAIKSDGTLWGWGQNMNFQLGDGTKLTRPTPVPSIPGNDWKQAATGGSSFGIKEDGTLWAWGNNWAGQLGTGDSESTPDAMQVGTSTKWVKVVGGGVQTVGLQSDGSLWFWGSPDGNGQGTNNLKVPTLVSPGTKWLDACFGYFMVLAIKSDGTLWAWGNRANLYTDLEDTNLNSMPMQVGTDSDWQSISSSRGCFYHLLKKKDGSFWALDGSEFRTLKPDSYYKPVKFKKLNLPKDIVAFAAGGDNMGIVLTRDGEVWTWGNVIGDHNPEDFWTPNNRRAEPEYEVKETPWQLSISD